MVLKLSDQDGYDPCVKEFTKESNVVLYVEHTCETWRET